MKSVEHLLKMQHRLGNELYMTIDVAIKQACTVILLKIQPICASVSEAVKEKERP